MNENRSGLALGLANVGDVNGVVGNYATCWSGDEETKPRLGFLFVGASRPNIPPGISLALTFSTEIYGLVDLQGGETQTIEDDAAARTLRSLRGVFGGVLQQIEQATGRKIDPLPESFELTCSISVEGQNDPPVVRLRLSIHDVPEGPDQVIWLPDPLTP